MYIPKRTDDDYARIAKIRDGDDEFEGLDLKEVEEEGQFLKLPENLERMLKAGNEYSYKAADLTQRLLTAQNPEVISQCKRQQQ